MTASPHKKTAIVFDFMGVLFNNSARAMYAERFERTGRSPQQLEHFLTNVFTAASRSDANFGTMKAVLEKLAIEHPEWADDLHAFSPERDWIHQVRGTVDGMPELIQELRHTHNRSVFGLTNCAADTIHALKKHFDFLAQLNDIVISGEEGIKKPNPEIFRRAARRFNIAPENLYFFDDKQANVDAARAAGWNAQRFEGAHTVRIALGI